MAEIQKTMRVIPAGQWIDSRLEQRKYWRARPGGERVRFGRELFRKNYWRRNGRQLPSRMERTVRPFQYKA